MYKQKLQEVCQQRQWALPLYTSTKDGPDHNPRFWASVTVNGATFDGPLDFPSRTSKEAHNEAARVAFHHIVPSPAAPLPPPAAMVEAAPAPPQSFLAQPPSCSSSARIEVDDDPARNDVLKSCGSDANALTMDAREMQHLYKIQLQSYTQKRNLNLPTYDCVREGSLCALRYKALVTVDGQIFESPQFFDTLKDAEHAAAKVALMSLSTVGNQEEEHGFYKNLLQELTLKEGLSLPNYDTVRDGPSHKPTFSSTVKIEGEIFQGNSAKTKKQAEINAARVAWARLRERKLSRLHAGFSSRFQILDINDDFSSLPSMDSQLPRACQPPVLCSKPDKEENVASEDEGAHVIEQVEGCGCGNSTASLQKPHSTQKRGWSPSPSPSLSPSSSDDVYASLRDPFPEESVLSDDEISSVSPLSECLGHPTNRASVCPTGSGDSLLCNRVRVYAHTSNFQLPPGTKLLPFSDEMWVAVIVDPSSEASIPV